MRDSIVRIPELQLSACSLESSMQPLLENSSFVGIVDALSEFGRELYFQEYELMREMGLGDISWPPGCKHKIWGAVTVSLTTPRVCAYPRHTTPRPA